MPLLIPLSIHDPFSMWKKSTSTQVFSVNATVLLSLSLNQWYFLVSLSEPGQPASGRPAHHIINMLSFFVKWSHALDHFFLHHDPFFMQVSSSSDVWIWCHCLAMCNYQKKMPKSIKGSDRVGGIWFWWIGQFGTSSQLEPVLYSRLYSQVDCADVIIQFSKFVTLTHGSAHFKQEVLSGNTTSHRGTVVMAISKTTKGSTNWW